MKATNEKKDISIYIIIWVRIWLKYRRIYHRFLLEKSIKVLTRTRLLALKNPAVNDIRLATEIEKPFRSVNFLRSQIRMAIQWKTSKYPWLVCESSFSLFFFYNFTGFPISVNCKRDRLFINNCWLPITFFHQIPIVKSIQVVIK